MKTAKKDISIRDDASDRRFAAIDGVGDRFGELVDHLLKNGYLTEEQIEYARRVQGKLEAAQPLLQVIKELKFITDDQIKEALRKHTVSIRIGELLVELGYVDAADLKTAIRIQTREK